MFGKLIEKAKKAGFKSGGMQVRTFGNVKVTMIYAEAPAGSVKDKSAMKWLEASVEGVSVETIHNLDDSGDGKGKGKKDNLDGVYVKNVTGELAREFSAELNRVDPEDGEPLTGNEEDSETEEGTVTETAKRK